MFSLWRLPALPCVCVGLLHGWLAASVGRVEGMSKHTPGPWTAIRDEARVGRGALVIGSQHATLAVLTGSPAAPGVCADARLIAASPDLLEACQKMLRAAWGEDHERTGAALRDAEKSMRAAIAKAEGR
jgi:hypothetical protein